MQVIHKGLNYSLICFVFIFSRFIINIPSEQRVDLVRILFAVELAHWYYIDFYCEDDNELHTCGIKDFAHQSKVIRLNEFNNFIFDINSFSTLSISS